MGVLLATVSVLGQVNAFSVFTDAIGVTSTAPGPNGDTESGSEPDTNPDDDSNDTGAGSDATAITEIGTIAADLVARAVRRAVFGAP